MTMVPNPLIREIYETEKVYDLDGKEHQVWAHITEEHCYALYRTVLKFRPLQIVEIGMSCGLSSLAMLTALDEIGEGGKLVSIDPYQSTDRKNLGVANVKRAGFEHVHRLIEEPDYLALPDLLREGTKIDFSYIDGWHTFDYVLLDFFYIDKMLRTGGVVGFNDCGWFAIHKALKFLKTHRRYEEEDVGLRRDYRGRNFLYTAARKYLDFQRNDRYFVKQEDWEPKSDFYARF